MLGDPDVLVAYDLDGAPLRTAHGYPARILIPGRYGMKGPKWLDVIELAKSEPTGYWEGQGWDRQAIVKTTSRIDVPADGALLKLGPIGLAGVAFAGVRGVQAVEFSVDGVSKQQKQKNIVRMLRKEGLVRLGREQWKALRAMKFFPP